MTFAALVAALSLVMPFNMATIIATQWMVFLFITRLATLS